MPAKSGFYYRYQTEGYDERVVPINATSLEEAQAILRSQAEGLQTRGWTCTKTGASSYRCSYVWSGFAEKDEEDVLHMSVYPAA